MKRIGEYFDNENIYKAENFLAMESSLENKVNKLEQGTNKRFKVVFEGLDSVEEAVEAKLPSRRKRIGLK